MSRVASLPTLAPAHGGEPSGTRRETPTLSHSPLADVLLTAPAAGSTGPTGGLRVQSFDMAAPGMGAADIPGQATPQVRGASASVSPVPGRPDRLRSAHLPAIGCPMLFIEGTRDPLCNLDQLRTALRSVAAPVQLHVIEGADHSFRVLKRLGRSEADVASEIVGTVADWVIRNADLPAT